MARNPEPVVLIHGYSDNGDSFRKWREVLVRNGFATKDVAVCNYQSLTNEVTIRDIAEGFDRALRTHDALSDDQPFNAIVHSTGMLVLRSWMTTYAKRRSRLKRLVALAPATFGSPLAHKGRGFLGALFKGKKNVFSPDFLEAGDQILDALELGSRFTWDLTVKDTLCEEPTFKKGPDSPYAFILCGTKSYGGIRQLAREYGTDGTVRWAGCSLNTEMITVDFARDSAKKEEERVTATNHERSALLPMPVWLVEGHNHGTILTDPQPELQALVVAALQVSDEASFEAWQAEAAKVTDHERRVADGEIEEWQQFVVRAMDERGDPITDFFVQMHTSMDDEGEALDFDFNPHTYAADKSLRCFHVNLTELRKFIKDNKIEKLYLRVIASSGSTLVGYHGISSERMTPDGSMMVDDKNRKWDARIELPLKFNKGETTLFYPFTTTLVELALNRDPMPFGKIKNNLVSIESVV